MNGSVAWVCTVCGYVHRGETPPETCPVCGAPSSDFERQADTPKPPKPKSGQWRCLICSYVHAGGSPPDACPVCGAPADDFGPLDDAANPEPSQTHTGALRFVIVGGGIAGLAAAESIRGARPDARITLISKESAPPYYRLNLTRYLAGEIGADSLPVHPDAWYSERDVRLLLGEEVAGIDPADHAVQLANDVSEPYDKLVLACGAHPFMPPIEGSALEGVTALRTRGDADRILDTIRPGAPWVVIGGGILGLETAGALARRGARVTVVENFGWLLPRQLDAFAAKRLHAFVTGKSIEVLYQRQTSAFKGNGRVQAVQLADGSRLPAEGVVVAAGIRSNSHLARKAGLEVNQGIVVDAHLTASHADIFAAGDAAEHHGIVYGLWEPARYQGQIAGLNAAGLSAEFGGLPRVNTLKVLGFGLFSVGTIAPADGSYTVIRDETGEGCRVFLFHDNALVGAILVGDTRLSAELAKAVKTRRDCSALLRANPSATDVAAFFSGEQA
ncbi:MAG TPA: FAD-dependent oxidoreductase [Candidatus Hydrogenedentes bacterium]|nr:FAD-dependent oxidoreductase [Candidatus Hydrogenedentota bacterium]